MSPSAADYEAVAADIEHLAATEEDSDAIVRGAVEANAYRVDTGEHLVSANQVAVFIDTAARRPVAVPDVFRDEVARFEGQEIEA